MMQRFRICLLPAVLLATLSFYSCKKDTAKEPDQPVTVDSNAVDNGLWNLDERMDLTYRPGDNFDMYCSGTWWQTACSGESAAVFCLFSG